MASALVTSLGKSDVTPRAAPRGPVLAIDYGSRRLGLALSDELGLTAAPFAIWSRTNRRHDLARLQNLCRLRGVTTVIVGWPLLLDGSQGEMAEEAGKFAERLRRHLGLPVELVDERLSSWEAQQALHEVSPRGSASRNRKRATETKTLDDVAAAVILRDYLSRIRRASGDALQE